VKDGLRKDHDWNVFRLEDKKPKVKVKVGTRFIATDPDTGKKIASCWGGGRSLPKMWNRIAERPVQLWREIARLEFEKVDECEF